MKYISTYDTPFGESLLEADDIGLTRIVLDGSCYVYDGECEKRETPAIIDAKRWLEMYFGGKQPDFRPQMHLIGSKFSLDVWKHLEDIPYGTTVTYGQIARAVAKDLGVERMSAQAVGGAVGRNPISIIIPCHRVMGADGNVTGYAEGVDKKVFLLKLEGAYKQNFYVKEGGK